ncbi:unnamed protein product [Phaedon cochleariae]|uniref:Tetraspanin n=1 Tax=Phaedon cochleariae TaxID=80249 RepID=A0A9N9X4X7_PHACE|nr:unnamed protein product [Phaedon cochleariae]
MKKLGKIKLKSGKTKNKEASNQVPKDNIPNGTEESKLLTGRLVEVKLGKPVYDVTFKTIKLLTMLSLIFIFCSIIFSLKLFSSSVSIKNHLGSFINMISSGDGEKLPLLQSLPVLFFLILDVILAFFLFKLFDRNRKSKFNYLLYIFIMIAVGLVFVTLVLIIVVLNHVYGSHANLHDGIVEAMSNYSTNSLFKRRIDRLQIEFQCCGSKKYDEWYNITWYDTSLSKKKGAKDSAQGNAPFSCCSITSLFPCIHHNIESTGKAYLYTPEQNLSISTSGCYDKLKKRTEEVGWGIVGNLMLYILLQCGLIVCLRFLQTAHFAKFMFDGHSRLYTVWLFGCGSVVKNVQTETPMLPPVPEDLMTF